MRSVAELRKNSGRIAEEDFGAKLGTTGRKRTERDDEEAKEDVGDEEDDRDEEDDW